MVGNLIRISTSMIASEKADNLQVVKKNIITCINLKA